MSRLILPITFKAPAKSTDGTMHIGEFYPTVNHVYKLIQTGSGKKKRSMKVIKPEAQPLLEEMALLAREWARKTGWTIPEKGKKVIVRTWFYFRNGNHPDCHNCEKLPIDQLQGIIFRNDKTVLIQEQDFFYPDNNPRMELEFEVVE